MAWAAALLLSAACNPAMAPGDIQDVDARRRALAVRDAAERGDHSAVPLLVDRLEDEDETVRFYAILALERLTDKRFGYVYYKAPAAQSDAIALWRRFVRAQAVSASATQPAGWADILHGADMKTETVGSE